MIRWVIAIVWVSSTWASLGLPAVAHARSPVGLGPEIGPAMCGDGSQTVLRDDLQLLEPGVRASAAARGTQKPQKLPARSASPSAGGTRGVVPRAAEVKAPDVVQASGVALGSVIDAAVLERPARALVSAPVEEDGPPAWCITPDDPRCSPRPQGAPMHEEHAPAAMHGAVKLTVSEQFGCSGADQTFLPARGAPRAGVSFRLERPPQTAATMVKL